MTASLATASKIRSPSTASSQNSLIPRRKRTLLERPDHHRAEHRARYGPRAAKDIHAADNDSCDHAKLEAAPSLDRNVAETREKHEAGEPDRAPQIYEGQEDDPLDRQSDELRRFGIGADRIEPSGEAADTSFPLGKR